MLVTCSKCGKIYDYEKYSGICPKCARYNNETTAAEEHQEYHDRYDGGYNHTAEDGHHSYHESYDDSLLVHSEYEENAKVQYRTPSHSSAHQLEGVQETLNEVMGANLEGKTPQIRKIDEKSKKILIIIAIVFGINFLVPLLFTILGLLFSVY